MKKKLMFIDENKIVNFSGGIERVICAMANEFVKRGYDASIVCLDTEKGMPFFPLAKDVKFFNLAYSFGTNNFGGFGYFFKKIEKELIKGFCGSKMKFRGKQIEDPKKKYFNDEFIKRLAACMKQEKPDIIIPILANSAWLAFKAFEYGNLKKVPVVPMNHIDPTLVDFSGRLQETLCHCNVTQALLPIYVDTFKKLGIERVEVIPNIVPQFAEDELLNNSVCNNRIINVGRLDGAGKRQHLLIEAFAVLADKYPEWKVSLYGDIANKGYKKKLDKLVAKHGLQNRVIFEGTKKDIINEMRKSDIFVFPSAYEGFGLALTEAMSIGLPVVAYKECKTVASIIKNGQTGLLADKGVEALAKKIELLMNDTELRYKLGKAAHEDMKQYAPKIVWDKWEKLILEVLCK